MCECVCDSRAGRDSQFAAEETEARRGKGPSLLFSSVAGSVPRVWWRWNARLLSKPQKQLVTAGRWTLRDSDDFLVTVLSVCFTPTSVDTGSVGMAERKL